MLEAICIFRNEFYFYSVNTIRCQANHEWSVLQLMTKKWKCVLQVQRNLGRNKLAGVPTIIWLYELINKVTVLIDYAHIINCCVSIHFHKHISWCMQSTNVKHTKVCSNQGHTVQVDLFIFLVTLMIMLTMLLFFLTIRIDEKEFQKYYWSYPLLLYDVITLIITYPNINLYLTILLYVKVASEINK